MHPEHPRQTTGPIILSLLTMAGFLIFLILVSGGFFLWVVAGTVGIFLVGGLHYLMWGATLDAQTEGDREEDRVRREMEQPNGY